MWNGLKSFFRELLLWRCWKDLFRLYRQYFRTIAPNDSADGFALRVLLRHNFRKNQCCVLTEDEKGQFSSNNWGWCTMTLLSCAGPVRDGGELNVCSTDRFWKTSWEAQRTKDACVLASEFSDFSVIYIHTHTLQSANLHQCAQIWHESDEALNFFLIFFINFGASSSFWCFDLGCLNIS